MSMAHITILSPAEQKAARESGKILRACLEACADHVRAGMTTGELDAFAERFITDHTGATPAFKGYHGFPATLCTSLNDVCVHGIPGKHIIQEGDILSIDGGVSFGGIITDACLTVGICNISDEAAHLLTVTSEALATAVSIITAGVKVGDISEAVQTYAEAHGCTPVPSLTGHGVGHHIHEYPDIPNVGQAGTGPAIPAGALIAVEPILTLGSGQVSQDRDGWTLRTRDGALCAHFEHTLLVGEEGCEIVA